MRGIRLSLVILGASAVPLAGQPVYNATPDWVSTDTPYSTGGALIDLDGDGWLDFVVANGNDIRREQLAVYYNNGDGTFPTTPDWQSADLEYNGHLSVADVNGDGWLDVAVGLTMADPSTATARVYLNNGGALSSLPDWESHDETAAFHVAFGDVNGDGRPDLAVGTSWPYDSPHIWHNYVYLNVDGALESTPSWVSDDTWGLGEVFFCDVNRDGWLDLIGVGEDTDTWIYLNNGGALATSASWHTTDNAGQFSVMGTYGDMDGDGWFELFVTDNTQLFNGSGEYRRYDGLSGGSFTTTPTWSYYDGYGSAVALADIDADGDLDLATGAWWDRTRYFLNTDGLLPSAPDFSSDVASVVEAIVFGDVNNDGLRGHAESFDVTATPGRHLFQLPHQPVERIETVTVDGIALGPDEFTFDAVHGWVSIGPGPTSNVTIAYVFTLKPDMAVTNWDDGLGNFLYYNVNEAAGFGDFDGNGDVDLDDYDQFVQCFTGPAGGRLEPGCEPGDFDLDEDIDCDDFFLFSRAWTEPGLPPALPQCPCQPADAPQPEPEPVAKNRYLSFVPGNAGRRTALRVTLIEPPAELEVPQPHSMWVDAPQQVSEESGSSGETPGPTFAAAGLTCAPVYFDWEPLEVLHVSGEALFPGARIDVQVIAEGCVEDVETYYSAALTLGTSMWGDLAGDCSVTPCTPPDGDVDFDDIAAVVDKFKNLPTAPIKARADIAPQRPDRIVDFVDIPAVVDAFRSLPYPYGEPPWCP